MKSPPLLGIYDIQQGPTSAAYPGQYVEQWSSTWGTRIPEGREHIFGGTRKYVTVYVN
jgi:hypothetical protein